MTRSLLPPEVAAEPCAALSVSHGWAPWIVVGTQPLENGLYEIEGCDWQYDCELEPGQIEIYDHPERGQSYWDDMGDDGTDFAGHISTFWLLGERIRRVLPNTQGDTRPAAK